MVDSQERTIHESGCAMEGRLAWMANSDMMSFLAEDTSYKSYTSPQKLA